jgi:hypothetical protein
MSSKGFYQVKWICPRLAMTPESKAAVPGEKADLLTIANRRWNSPTFQWDVNNDYS